jgi:1-acyl-sn-glycerol-3-phosphate acyltransferase
MVLKFIHSLFFYLLTVTSFIVGTTTAHLFSPFSKSSTKPFQITAQLWARFLTLFSGVRIKISGIENLPKDTPLILVANHQSAADILILLAYLPVHFRFAVKKELFRIPVFGYYMRKAGYSSVDREVVLSAYKALEAITEIIKSGESVLIFPEGTRSKTGELGKFRRGSLLTALRSGAPLIPIAISGSYKVLPIGTWLINPGPIKLSIGKPIHIKSKADYNGKVEEVREAIARML